MAWMTPTAFLNNPTVLSPVGYLPRAEICRLSLVNDERSSQGTVTIANHHRSFPGKYSAISSS